jgi:hypothetical protein
VAYHLPDEPDQWKTGDLVYEWVLNAGEHHCRFDQHIRFLCFSAYRIGQGVSCGGDLQGFGYFTGPTRKQALEAQDVVQLGAGTAVLDQLWHQTNVVQTNNSAGFAIAFRLDRASDATSASSANNLTGTIHSIGDDFRSTNQVYAGYIAEIILYNRVLTGTEVTTIETYFHTKYGL